MVCLVLYCTSDLFSFEKRKTIKANAHLMYLKILIGLNEPCIKSFIDLLYINFE